MTDDAETGDPSYNEGRQSKRALLKDAFTRTKSRFKKNETDQDLKLNNDVAEFLAAGRISISQPSDGDTLPIASAIKSTDPPTSIPSPRRIPVPRLDISQSPRWPSSQPHNPDPRPRSADFLQPWDTSGRSQSLSSFKQRRTKPRQLSVSFVNSPPVIIGEGGDSADAPPKEISWAKEKAAFLMPGAVRPSSKQSDSNVSISSQERSPIRRKPVPPKAPPQNDQDLLPRTFNRVQTGLDGNMRSIATQEFDQSLQTAKSSATNGMGHFRTPLFSPNPVRPVALPTVPDHSIMNGSMPVVDPSKFGTSQVVVIEDEAHPAVLEQQQILRRTPIGQKAPMYPVTRSEPNSMGPAWLSSNSTRGTNNGHDIDYDI